jgi:RND family efflux transporter MFP subunit
MNMNFYNKTLVAIICAFNAGLVGGAELVLTPEQQKTANVDTITVTAQKNSSRIRLTGTLTADQRKSTRIAPIVEGTVTHLYVVAHDSVRKAQVLATLRSASLGQAQGDYLEALARLELAQAESTRIESLSRDGIVAESRLLKATSEYKTARAIFEQRQRLLTLAGLSDRQIKALEEKPDLLAEFELTSPIDGIVTASMIESGQLLAAGEAAFHVDDLSSLWLEVQIPVASLSLVALGAEAQIQVQSNPDRPFRGELQSLGAEVDSGSQTLAGRIVVQNPDAMLFPGMYAKVTLSGIANQGLMVPESSVFSVGDQAYVFQALGEGQFDPVPVTVGPATDGLIPIYSSIEIGVAIATRGVAELKAHWQYQESE